MKYLGTALSSAALAVAASPVFAQATSNAPATPANPPPYGYGPMWGYGYHHMWGFQPFGHVLGIILVVLLILWLVRLFRFGGYHGHWRHRHAGYGYGHGSSALDILEERFAKGEIDKNEFEEKRKALMR